MPSAAEPALQFDRVQQEWFSRLTNELPNMFHIRRPLVR
jgi:hypothetical protein